MQWSDGEATNRPRTDVSSHSDSANCCGSVCQTFITLKNAFIQNVKQEDIELKIKKNICGRSGK